MHLLLTFTSVSFFESVGVERPRVVRVPSARTLERHCSHFNPQLAFGSNTCASAAETWQLGERKHWVQNGDTRSPYFSFSSCCSIFVRLFKNITFFLSHGVYRTLITDQKVDTICGARLTFLFLLAHDTNDVLYHITAGLCLNMFTCKQSKHRRRARV